MTNPSQATPPALTMPADEAAYRTAVATEDIAEATWFAAYAQGWAVTASLLVAVAAFVALLYNRKAANAAVKQAEHAQEQALIAIKASEAATLAQTQQLAASARAIRPRIIIEEAALHLYPEQAMLEFRPVVSGQTAAFDVERRFRFGLKDHDEEQWVVDPETMKEEVGFLPILEPGQDKPPFLMTCMLINLVGAFEQNSHRWLNLEVCFDLTWRDTMGWKITQSYLGKGKALLKQPYKAELEITPLNQTEELLT